MKKNVLLVLMCMFAISSYARKENESVTFNVKLDCENCINKIESNLAFEKGVKDLACSLEKQSVTVTYAADKTNVEDLKKGFAKIGYDDVTVKKTCCSTEKAKTCSSKDADKKACPKDCDKACCSKDADKKACSTDGDKACCSKDGDKKACSKEGDKACCSKDTDKKACSTDGDKACYSKEGDKKACSKEGDKACCSKDADKKACCNKEKKHKNAEEEEHVD